MMDKMKKVMTFILVSSSVVFLACGNKERKTEHIDVDVQTTIEEYQADTTITSVQIESPKQEYKQSTHMNSPSSSSRSHRSSGYDNMRGFDPASEDDMEDNGMSRYMENNDEGGWE